MKNKLLTTALVGSLVSLGSVAVAQTTITGNLDLSFQTHSSSGGTAAQRLDSDRYFGKESQINIQNKGKLTNGMDYAAGFSIELDGPDGNTNYNASTNGAFNENVYIDITLTPGTTFTVGADHIQNLDRNITNLAGFGYLGIDGVNNVISSYSKTGGSIYSAYGAGLVQDIGKIGKLSAYYAPTNSGVAQNDIFNGVQTTGNATADSAYEFVFKGDLGVKGAEIGLAYNKQEGLDKPTQPRNDLINKKIDGKYTVGQFTIAGDYVKSEGITTGTGTISGYTAGLNEHKSKSVGLGYAVNKDLSVSYAYGKTDTNKADSPDEKNQVIAIGYNLGPVAVGLQYKNVDNHANTSGLDADAYAVRLSTKF